jgi:hypothetical protein
MLPPLIPRRLCDLPFDSRLRNWRSGEADWRKARELLESRYGYDRYQGNCHIVPNHGLVILSLLYGDNDFQKSLMIANTCGWDTDCNSGNVGCLLGIKNGLPGIDCGPNWREPVADRLYISSADGGRAISDALTEAYHIANIGRALSGEAPVLPKDGARFHFAKPGAVQGFMAAPSEPASQAKFTLRMSLALAVEENVACPQIFFPRPRSIRTNLHANLYPT